MSPVSSSIPVHVPHKWGFGMAPLKPEHAAKFDAAVALTLAYLDEPSTAYGRRDEVADAFSEVKGLFNRSLKADQWDWFVVCTRLGSPTNRIVKACGGALNDMRQGLTRDDDERLARGLDTFRKWGGPHWLKLWTAPNQPLDDGWGYVYILSTRNEPDMLKVGFTTRPVSDRVAEINAASGVAVPYGARRAWRVYDPRTAEKLVHQTLAEYRVRADREFFALDGRIAIPLVDEAIHAHRLDQRS